MKDPPLYSLIILIIIELIIILSFIYHLSTLKKWEIKDTGYQEQKVSIVIK